MQLRLRPIALAGSCLVVGVALCLTKGPQATGSLPRRSGTVRVSTLPEYQSAVHHFARGDRSVAQRALMSLLQRPDLTEMDRAFLRRQLALTQTTTKDCGPRALALACQALGVSTDSTTLAKLSGMGSEGTTLEGLQRAARALGLTAEGVQVDRDALLQLRPPALVWLDGNHYVVLRAVGEVATIQDPNDTEQSTLPLTNLLARSGGILLTLHR